MKVRNLVVSILAVMSVLSTNVALSAGKALSADEVKALFSGKTFDGFNANKKSKFKAYSSSEGILFYKNRGTITEMTWMVDANGQHCTQYKNQWCGQIVPAGNGVYQKIINGKVALTLSNFVDGKQL